MNIESMLKSYPRISKMIYEWNQDLNYNIATSLVLRDSEQILDGMPKGSGTSDPTGETVLYIHNNIADILADIEKSTESLRDNINQLIDFQRKVDRLRMELEPEEWRVIELRLWVYPEPDYTWVRVERESGYCEQHGRRIIKKFIKMLEEAKGYIAA